MDDTLRLLRYRPFTPAEPIGGAVKKLDAGKIDEFLGNAKKFLGQWYLWGGGHSSKTGIQRVDCSGLVLQAARLSGLNLDGTAAMQQNMGKPVSMKELQAGDLVFSGTPAHHVGIYLGDGKVIHAPHTGAKVQIIDLSGSGFDNARRVFDGEAPAAPAAAEAPKTEEKKPVKPVEPKLSAAQAAVGGPGYVVQRGESLWKIAERTLGDRNRWREIFELNKDALYNNPNLAFPGSTLVLPVGANVPTAPQSAGVAPAATAAAPASAPAHVAPIARTWNSFRSRLADLGMRADNAIADSVPRLQQVMANMTHKA